MSSWVELCEKLAKAAEAAKPFGNLSVGALTPDTIRGVSRLSGVNVPDSVVSAVSAIASATDPSVRLGEFITSGRALETFMSLAAGQGGPPPQLPEPKLVSCRRCNTKQGALIGASSSFRCIDCTLLQKV